MGSALSTSLVIVATSLALASGAPYIAHQSQQQEFGQANSASTIQANQWAERKVADVPAVQISFQPRWMNVPRIREFKVDGGLFTDILSRVSFIKWYGDYGTTAHEATHFLNNEISGGTDWAYYVGDGRAARLAPPQFVMADVARVFPETARGPMYDFYVVGIPENEPVPMVLLDEWTAYYNDVRVQMQLSQHFPKEERVSVTEQLAEFCVIGLAVHDAVERQDPAYLETHPEFTIFIAWLLEQSLATYDASGNFERFKWEEKYMTPRVRRYLDARLKMFSPSRLRK